MADSVTAPPTSPLRYDPSVEHSVEGRGRDRGGADRDHALDQRDHVQGWRPRSAQRPRQEPRPAARRAARAGRPAARLGPGVGRQAWHLPRGDPAFHDAGRHPRRQRVRAARHGAQGRRRRGPARTSMPCRSRTPRSPGPRTRAPTSRSPASACRPRLPGARPGQRLWTTASLSARGTVWRRTARSGPSCARAGWRVRSPRSSGASATAARWRSHVRRLTCRARPQLDRSGVHPANQLALEDHWTAELPLAKLSPTRM